MLCYVGWWGVKKPRFDWINHPSLSDPNQKEQELLVLLGCGNPIHSRKSGGRCLPTFKQDSPQRAARRADLRLAIAHGQIHSHSCSLRLGIINIRPNWLSNWLRFGGNQILDNPISSNGWRAIGRVWDSPGYPFAMVRGDVAWAMTLCWLSIFWPLSLVQGSRWWVVLYRQIERSRNKSHISWSSIIWIGKSSPWKESLGGARLEESTRRASGGGTARQCQISVIREKVAPKGGVLFSNF